MSSNMQRYSMPSAGIYDLVAGRLFGGRYEAIAREIAAESPPYAAILDAGCGPGEVLIRLAATAPALQLTGLDLDLPMIERARHKAAKALRGAHAPGRPPTFVVGDVACMPFPDASFDLVVSSFSVHHWPDPHAGLAEVMRVLKPGGRAIVWDIASPMERATAVPGGSPHAAHGPATASRPIRGAPSSGPSWWLALRMLLQFRRLEPQRFEVAKPA